MERLKMAVLYGADTVYLAGTSFGMRAFGNCSMRSCPRRWPLPSHGVRSCHHTMPRNDEAARLPGTWNGWRTPGWTP
ncbi:MAG: hypothetical protein ACLTYN_14200 [Dysosmobacter welbionis]